MGAWKSRSRRRDQRKWESHNKSQGWELPGHSICCNRALKSPASGITVNLHVQLHWIGLNQNFASRKDPWKGPFLNPVAEVTDFYIQRKKKCWICHNFCWKKSLRGQPVHSDIQKHSQLSDVVQINLQDLRWWIICDLSRRPISVLHSSRSNLRVLLTPIASYPHWRLGSQKGICCRKQEKCLIS